jgi:hypothetical protein
LSFRTSNDFLGISRKILTVQSDFGQISQIMKVKEHLRIFIGVPLFRVIPVRNFPPDIPKTKGKVV